MIKGNSSPHRAAPRASENITNKEFPPSVPWVVCLYHPPRCKVLKQPLPFWWLLVYFVQHFRGVSCLCPQSGEEKLSRNNRICLSSVDLQGNKDSERLGRQGLFKSVPVVKAGFKWRLSKQPKSVSNHQPMQPFQDALSVYSATKCSAQSGLHPVVS